MGYLCLFGLVPHTLPTHAKSGPRGPEPRAVCGHPVRPSAVLFSRKKNSSKEKVSRSASLRSYE